MNNGNTRGNLGIFNNKPLSGFARATSIKKAGDRKTASRALVRSAIEALETRCLLSATLTITGNSTATEGHDYALGLNATPDAHLTSWTINWGDGSVSKDISASLSSISHQYADAIAAYHITATGTDGTNTYTANVGSSSATGALDVNFGSSGTVTAAGAAAGTAVAVQSDGKLIVVGTNSSFAISVSRYNLDGTLDTTFGPGGTVTRKLGNQDTATSVAIQADDKIVVGGAMGVVSGSFSNRVEVLRFNADGTPDLSFGPNHDGRFTTTSVSSTQAGSIVNGVGVDRVSGKIIVAGTAGNASKSQLIVGRLMADGTPDTSFGSSTTGFVATQYSTAYTLDGGNALVLQPDGKIVVAGSTNAQPAIVRFDANGIVDPAFGNGGWVNAPGDASTNGSLASVAIDSTGRIVAAGMISNHWGLLRVSTGGAIDSSFGTKASPPALSAAAYSLAIQKDGQILVTGSSDNSNGPNGGTFATERYKSDGTRDINFGTGGIVFTNFGTPTAGSLARSILIRSDGRILVAGQLNGSLAMEQFDVSAAAAPVDVLVNDVPPILDLSPIPATSPEGAAITASFTVSDPNLSEITSSWTVTLGTALIAFDAGTTVHFTPPDNGSYLLTVTSQDDGGASTVATKTITVTNVPPTGTINGAPTTSPEAAPINLTSTVTDPGSLDTFTYQWSVTKNDGAGQVLATTPNFSFTPVDDGAYVVSLIVTDKDGGIGTADVRTITVTDVGPTAAILGTPATSPEGTAITLTAAATDPNPADTTAGFTYAWTVSKDGVSLPPSTGPTLTFTPDDNGSYVVTLIATDQDHQSSAAVSTTMVVTNVAPTVSAPATLTGTEGTPVSFTATVSDVSIADTNVGFSNSSWTVSKNGQANYAAGTGLTGNFLPDDNGLYIVTFTAADKDHGVGSATTAVTVSNVAPSIVLSHAITGGLEGSPVSFNAVVTDPSPVDVTAGFTNTWVVTDSKGTTVAGGTGSGTDVNFTPTDNGLYTITFTATDKDGGSSSATTSINIANVAPTVTLSQAPTGGLEGSPVSFNAVVTDPSSDDSATGFTDTWVVTNNNGAPAIAGSGAAVNFTPTDNGLYTITFTAIDKDGGIGVSSTSINVTNVAPSIVLSHAITGGLEGSPVSFNAVVTDPSPVDSATGFTDTWVVTNNIGAPAIPGSGTAVNFTPTDNGLYTITFTAIDKDGGSSSVATTITIANVAPTASITADTTGVRGQARHVNLSAIDPSSADTAAGFTYNINWGDGSPVQVVNPGDALNPGHVYNVDGSYHVTVTAADKDLAVSAPVFADIVITPVLIQGQTLSIGGFTSADILQLTQSSGPGGVTYLKLTDDFLLKNKLNESAFSRIDIYQADASNIFFSNNISDPIYLVDANGVIVQTLHVAH
jgi:uncharacterized delta-60 repeat protein